MAFAGRRASRVTPDSLMAAGQRRHRPDYQIILFIGLLVCLGLVVMYAIGPQRANVLNRVYSTDFYSENYFVLKQLVSLLFAGAAFTALAVVPFERLKRWSWTLVKIGFIGCVLLFIVGNVLHIKAIATETLGAFRWFNLGPLGSFQPAELLKLTMLIYIAGFLGKRYNEGKINDTKATIVPLVIMVGLALFMVVVLQKDMGTGISIASMVLAMFFASNMSWKWLGRLLVAAAICGVLAIVLSPHRMERIGTYVSGHSSSQASADSDNNYHIKNAMIALGSGGMTGRGIGKSVQATGYLPEAVNDSIFAIMGEIFGFVGTTVIIGLFGGLLLRLLKAADRLPDMSMRVAVAGIFGWLAAHVIMNIASMIGLIPLTGITLPLLSFGGTSMIFIAGALGLAFQLSRYTAHKSIDAKEVSGEDTRSWRGIGRTRYAGRRRTQGN